MIAQSPSATPATPLEPLMAEFHLAVHYLRVGCRNESASTFVARSMRAVQGSRRFLRNKGGSQRSEAFDFWNVFRFPTGTHA
jgi:hypothetical protein